MPGNVAFDHHPGIIGEGVWQVDAAEYLIERAAGHHVSLLKQHQMISQSRHFIRRVTDVDDRHRELLSQPLQVGKDFELALHVQRRKRFVHQQDLRRTEQCAGNRHALAFAAGKLVGGAVEKMRDAKQFGNFGQDKAVLTTQGTSLDTFLPEFHVAANGKV